LPNIQIKKAEPADAEILLAYSKKTFYEFFAHLNAGYIKINFNDAQTEYKDKNALEVERIYVSGEHHGKQIGKQLLDFAINTARSKQFAYVWLGVWEHNGKAIGFYKHHGFEPCGSHDFMLGDDKQTDLLMKKML